MKKFACVFIGTEKEANAELLKYKGHGYYTYVIPRIDVHAEVMTGEYGLYVRKCTIKDLRKKENKVAAIY